ncbi:MAG: RiPP maturation radical SAM C-methyltransferase [Thermodesulfobacteriota bacterium]
MAINRKGRDFKGRVALVSAPWPLFSRPSIQLGALKAYLRQAFPDISVSASHFYLTLAEAVGYSTYLAVSRETWLAESVYAALLYPERAEPIGRFFDSLARRSGISAGLDFSALVRRVKTVTDLFIRQTDWAALDLAGFSVCLCQLTASLYLMRRVRRRAPQLPLIAGGSIVGGNAAADLLEVFPEIDLIVAGEGEEPLTRLVGHLRAGGQCHDIPPGPGIVRRGDGHARETVSFGQLPDLAGLPVPDYTDYFQALAGFPGQRRFFPMLPMEMSRGCWWQGAGNGAGPRDRKQGCAFCNLNSQWRGYRAKSPDQVADEVEQLVETHRILAIVCMDNALPPKTSRDIFAVLAARGRDLQLFAELRASTDRPTLEAFRSAGGAEAQIGIESLSSRLLRKMNKGTTAMDNLAIMKNCEALGIKNAANLMVCFPGSDEGDVTETLRVISFARFFRPLHIVRFWLGMHSPVRDNPAAYGLTAVYNHPYYKELFPEDICRRTRLMIQDYRGGKMAQRRLWQPVVRAVEQWQRDYARLHAGAGSGPILTQHDGRSFLILRERRVGGEPVNHRLEGTSREIYLFCERPRNFEEIRVRFSPLPAERLQSFLDLMTGKGLMFEDGGVFFSLAVSPHPYRYPGCP